MKTNRTNKPLAVLAANNPQVGLAALSLSVEKDGWCQLLPTGRFNSIDGRPFDVPGRQWILNKDIADRLIQRAKNAANELVIDYEHQTLNKEENGQPAPAAGWIKDMEWREGSGLWIKPEWTPRALEFIRNKEYRYLSAVFPYEETTGMPLYIHSAALTNRAGVDGMQALEALSAHVLSTKPFTQKQENPAMNEAMRKLLAKLGIELKEGEQMTEAQEAAALSAVDKALAAVGENDGLKSQIAALSASDNLYDPAKHVPLEAFQELQKTVATLSAKSESNELDSVIAGAKKDGRLLPAMEGWARELGKKDMAALTAFLDKAQPMAALTSMQTQTAEMPEDKTGVAVLSADEKEAAKLLGKSEAEFLKIKTAQA